MSEKSTNAVISDEELNAAIAEVEAMQDVPSLDDGRDEKPVVTVPIPVPAVRTIRRQDAADQGSQKQAKTEKSAPTTPPKPTPAKPASAAATTQPDAARPRPRRGLLARVLAALAALSLPGLRKRRRRSKAAPEESSAQTEPAPAPEQDAAGARPSALSRLLWLLDTVLELVNRPFAFLTPEARRTIGAVSLVTLLVSVLAGYLLPILVPRQDPVTTLYRMRAEVLAAPADSDPESSD